MWTTRNAKAALPPVWTAARRASVTLRCAGSETAPFVGIADSGMGGLSGPIGWDTAQTGLQWYLYRFFGDTQLLKARWSRTLA
jgi:hypothetical protein